MTRYEEVTKECEERALQLMHLYFPELVDVKIKFLFDLKKRTHGKKLVLGKRQKPNELIKHFTAEEAKDSDGYQYVITLDKIAYINCCEDADKDRLLRHELRHVLVIEDEIKSYKINPHNIEDFVEEIALNADNPDWARIVAVKALKMYKQNK